MSNLENLYRERVKRIVTTAVHKEPDHVPVLHVAETWNLDYAGVKAVDVQGNMELEFESFCKPYEKIYCDGVLISCLTREIDIYNSLGGGAYFYSRDGVTIQHKEYVFMMEDEYPKFIEDPMGFSLEEIFPRKFPELNKPYPENLEALKNSLASYTRFLNRLVKSGQYNKEKHGMPAIVSGTGQAPFDIIMDFFRGFKGIMTDMRRRPTELAEACDALVPIMMATIQQGKTSLEPYPLVFFPLHAPTYLSTKQFEELYWPSFRKVLYKTAELGGKAIIALEGDWSHLYDFVNDFPKDFAIAMIEADDIFKVKDIIGKTVALSGGIDLSMLRTATKQECLDRVKKVVDYCAPGGGFIFSTDKGLIAPGDVNIENYAAVTEFVHTYGQY
ncbi:MAG: hypothetical protein GX127_09675 [Eubacteriaceae bacterium]|nr:hypothetical protein [Eubacteriaceae bacterium]